MSMVTSKIRVPTTRIICPILSQNIFSLSIKNPLSWAGQGVEVFITAKVLD